MKSLRQQLLTHLAIGLIIVLSGTMGFLYWHLRGILVSTFDAELLDKVRVFVKTTEIHSEGDLEFEFIESGIPEFERLKGTQYFQVWDMAEATIVRSPSLDERNLPLFKVFDEQPHIRDIALPNGHPGRAIYLKFSPRPAEEGEPVPVEKRPVLIAALAVPTASLLVALGKVFNGLFATALALILVITPTVRWSVRRGLRSLDLIGEQVAAIDTATLPHGFSSQGLPRELVPIAERLNDLLHRLHASFTRERRFTADAAHELRTPITELRTLAEVGIAEATITDTGFDGYFQDILAIAQHLERLVTTLLALARCESGLQGVHVQPFSVSNVINNAMSSSGRPRNDIRVTIRVPEHAEIQADPDLFKMMLINILSNAMTYASKGGRVDVTTERRERAWIISVTNTTSELSADDLRDFFTPFWRKRQNEHNESHYGLGLSLVSAYSSLLGLTVRADMPEPNLFRIEIVCPDSPQPASPASTQDHFASVP